MSLRVGIVGYGLAGRYFHAPLLKGCGFEIEAIATTSELRKGHALQDFPDVKVVDTSETLVKEKLDLVVVASVTIFN